MPKRLFIAALITVAGVGAGLWFGLMRREAPAESPADVPPLVQRAFEVKEDWQVKQGSRVFIVPHHVVPSKEIASLVSAMPKARTVYLVSPDHFTRGRTVFTTTDEVFASEVTGTTALADVIAREHGITALYPFFRVAMSDAKIVPIIVRLDATTADRERLTEALARHLQNEPDAIVVGSIDFSHYLPANVADFHDVLAEDVIRSLTNDQADKVELDSPGALAVTLGVARALGLGDVTIHAHTNSLRILKAEVSNESTSHFLVSFAPGAIGERRFRTMLLAPERNIVSAEGRLYQGQDEIKDGDPGALVGIVYEGEKEVRRWTFPYQILNGEPMLVIRGEPKRLLESNGLTK